MSQAAQAVNEYQGFEQGPIRPPSEANSLLIRVTRNCPWNRCTFCPVYKRSRFSIRPLEHVKKDIEAIYNCVKMLRERDTESGRIRRADIHESLKNFSAVDMPAFNAAYHWYTGGMHSIFIQDANSLIVNPRDLVDILLHLKKRFPRVQRITSYARSHTIARISDRDLLSIRNAGLNRIHIGLESGADPVLEKVSKGVSKKIHIKAGLKVKTAGMELSEYVMPGLGGKNLSRIHALETADALNRINPDFIRLRTLAVPDRVEIFKSPDTPHFEKCTDRMMAEEILLFINSLSGITSTVKSDHILNLFQEVEGQLPQDKARMMAPLQTFLNLPPASQVTYQVGRRLGMFSQLSDMESPHRRTKVEKTCQQIGVTTENVDEVIDNLMKRFI